MPFKDRRCRLLVRDIRVRGGLAANMTPERYCQQVIGRVCTFAYSNGSSQLVKLFPRHATRAVPRQNEPILRQQVVVQHGLTVRVRVKDLIAGCDQACGDHVASVRRTAHDVDLIWEASPIVIMLALIN